MYQYQLDLEWRKKLCAGTEAVRVYLTSDSKKLLLIPSWSFESECGLTSVKKRSVAKLQV